MRIKNILILLAVLIIAGGAYFAIDRLQPAEPDEPKYYVWKVSDDDIVHITITLTGTGQSQSFVKIVEGSNFPWFFDDEQNSAIDQDRWGGGIPLILSGPSPDRIIAESATDEQLALYGLQDPSMEIVLTLADSSSLIIDVGDPTPNGINYYVRAPGTTGVATIDYTWYDVLAALVTDPPYADSAP